MVQHAGQCQQIGFSVSREAEANGPGRKPFRGPVQKCRHLTPKPMVQHGLWEPEPQTGKHFPAALENQHAVQWEAKPTLLPSMFPLHPQSGADRPSMAGHLKLRLPLGTQGLRPEASRSSAAREARPEPAEGGTSETACQIRKSGQSQLPALGTQLNHRRGTRDNTQKKYKPRHKPLTRYL